MDGARLVAAPPARPGRRPRRRSPRVAAGAVAVVVSLASAVAFAARRAPRGAARARPSARLAGPTYDAVVAGVGAATGRGRRATSCAGATPPTSAVPGFGLLDELERRGLDVAADEYFQVPATEHRTRPRAEADAQIHLATGGYVDVWRAVAGRRRGRHVRSPHRRAAGRVRRRSAPAFVERLAAEGLDELVPPVDTNLFGMSVDTRLSAADQRRPGPPDRARPADGRVRRPAAGGRRPDGAVTTTTSSAVQPAVAASRYGAPAAWLIVAGVHDGRHRVLDDPRLARGFEPIGDNALIELRAWDVFTSDRPLLGTWSSASVATGLDLNHPGPLLFDYFAAARCACSAVDSASPSARRR